MKLPFDLGVKLVLRLLVPGFFLMLGLYPALAAVRRLAGWTISHEYLFIIGVLLAGWLVSSLDLFIYMLYEGRRGWPAGLWRWMVGREERRLQRTLDDEDAFYRLSKAGQGPVSRLAGRKYVEAWVMLREFPLGEDGHPRAVYPTRLGNLMTAYETYPKSRYGIDAIFYWYRLWLMLDKDLREELDTRQATADSPVYVSAALYVDALLWLAYALAYWGGRPLLRTPAAPGDVLGARVRAAGAALSAHLPPLEVTLLAAPAFALVGWAAYRVSLFAHAQYGESFKSVFDVHEKRIDVSRVVAAVARIVDEPSLVNRGRREQLRAAWYYLHNYRVKCPRPECEAEDSLSPEDYREHLRERHGTGAEPAPAPPAGWPERYHALYLLVYTAVRAGRSVRSSAVAGGAALLALGGLVHPSYFLLAAAVAVLAWTVEVRVRTAQAPRVREMREIEEARAATHAFQARHHVGELARAGWRDPALALPYLLLGLAGAALFAASR